MDYIIVKETFSSNLARSVNHKITEGYTPIGGVSCMAIRDELQFQQAMIKTLEEK